MNLFTKGQIERMKIIIENSPRRESLLTSPGLLEPEPVPNDLGINEMPLFVTNLPNSFVFLPPMAANEIQDLS